MTKKNRGKKKKASLAQRPTSGCLVEAETLFQSGQVRQAVELASSQIAANPEHRAFIESWGRELMKRREYDSAVIVFQLIADVFPNDAKAYNPLSVALSMAGYQDQALKSMMRCVELAPESWRNRLNMGKLYMLNEEWSKAKDTFNGLEGELPAAVKTQVDEMKVFCQEKIDYPIVNF